MRVHSHSRAILAAAMLAASSPALAQSEADPKFGDRTLKGHTFLFPATFDSAFVTTHLGMQQGAEWTSVTGVPFRSLGFVDLSSIGIVERIDLGIKLTEGFGLAFAGFGDVSTGINATTVIVKGAEYNYGGSGAFVGAVRFEETGTQLAARGGLTLNDGQLIGVLGLLDAALSQPGTTTAQVATGSLGALILVPTSGYALGGSLDLAQTVAPWLGLQASGVLRYASQRVAFADGVKRLGVIQPGYGLAVTVDANPYHVPLAAMLELTGTWASASSTTSSSSNTDVLSLGLYYSGRRDLQIGFVGSDTWGPPFFAAEGFSGRQPVVLTGLFVLRYVWGN